MDKIKLISKAASFSLAILLIAVTILMSVLQSYFSKQNIEFRNNVIIAQIVITWFFLPFGILHLYNKDVKDKMEETKALIAVSITSGIIRFMIIIIFLIRILSFMLFENRTEKVMGNGHIMVESNNLRYEGTKEYEPVSKFLYRYIQG